jgi:plasmid stabilization system protein ParE
MELILLARAEADVLTTQARLEDVQPELGDRFVEQVETAFDQLSAFPESGPLYLAPYRRLLVPGFPNGIFYSIAGRRIIVQAVLNLRQDRQAIERMLTDL